ncbi:MAG TPA: hypothetical protein VNA15_00515 [Candidatus Angelobacter sp.]|nr:hypothetical protein [Candidatus Angelobacter sp.]
MLEDQPPKSVTHVSKAPSIPRDFGDIPEHSLEKSLGIGSASLEPELQLAALKKIIQAYSTPWKGKLTSISFNW